jgi:hypothetical protein
MDNFEFEVVEYFKFSDNQICMSGYMSPADIVYITPDYKVQLLTSSGKCHDFNLIGEEIFARSEPRKDNKRVLRTTDDIEKYLKDLIHDPVKIVGRKFEK